MNLRKRIALTLALVTLAGLTAVGASAETQLRGTFTLPVQAYWGNTLLPAGDYSLTLIRDIGNMTPSLVYVRGEGVSATFMAPTSAEEEPTHSCLKLDDVNGTYVIRELDAGNPGKSYKFAVTKAVRNMTLRGSVATPVTVPVSGGF